MRVGPFTAGSRPGAKCGLMTTTRRRFSDIRVYRLPDVLEHGTFTEEILPHEL